MMHDRFPATLTPIERAIAEAVEGEFYRSLRARRPRSTHPEAIAAQDRRRIAALAQKTRELREAARRRAHRLELEASMEADRVERAGAMERRHG